MDFPRLKALSEGKLSEIFADGGSGHSAKSSGKPVVKWQVKYRSDKGIETKTMSARTTAEIKTKVKELGGKFIDANSMGRDELDEGIVDFKGATNDEMKKILGLLRKDSHSPEWEDTTRLSSKNTTTMAAMKKLLKTWKTQVNEGDVIPFKKKEEPKSTAVAKREPKAVKERDVTETELNKLIRKFEDKLDHDARYKSVDFSISKKVMWWVTQGTSPAGSKEAAEQLANLMGAEGLVGWTIKVVLRDEYGGRDDSPWKTAKSTDVIDV